MGELLNTHEFSDFNRTEPAYPSEIVSREIDEHRVLGPLFGIFQKLLCELCVLRRIASPGAGAGDWHGCYPPPLHPDEHLRARPDHLLAAKIEIIHIRARVDLPERSIDRERIVFYRTLHPARDHCLKDIPRDNVPLHSFYGSLKCFLRY